MPLEAYGVEVEIAGTPIVRGADLQVHPGELVAVVGPNGAGKSTLVRAVSGLQKPSAGIVAWWGREVGALRGRDLAKLRAFVPQRMPVPAGVTVREAVTIGRSSQLRPLGRMTAADREAIDGAMARADVTRFAERALPTLSGGELQRVQIAIGLAQTAPVLIADEPTSALDLGVSNGRTVATGPPKEVLTAERLAEVWEAHAHLTEHDGRTALHVAWLGS